MVLAVLAVEAPMHYPPDPLESTLISCKLAPAGSRLTYALLFYLISSLYLFEGQKVFQGGGRPLASSSLRIMPLMEAVGSNA